MKKLYGFATGVLLVAACAPDEAAPDSPLEADREAGRAACRRYLDCVLEATPEVVASLLPSYGPEGDCWMSEDLDVIELCTTACNKALEGYVELYKDIAACGECQDDTHCAGAAGRPRCDPRTNACVECVAATDCSAGTCKAEGNVCVECTNNGDCDGGACVLETNKCVQCVETADCDEGACLTEKNVCVDCLKDDDCASGACDLPNMRCVECKLHSQCPDGVCDYSNYTCVNCLNDSNCADGQTCVDKVCMN